MLKLITFLLATTLLAGCASKQLANQDALSALASAKATELGSDSEQALEKARSAHQEAVREELAFYAPLNMQQLEAALQEAQQADLKGDNEKTIQASARVLTLLDSGVQNKASARQQLAELFSQKDTLDDIKAGNVLPSLYGEKMEALKELISMIEAGDSDKAQKKSRALLTEFQALERDTMLALHWQPAADTLNKAESEDADNNAPQSFLIAEGKAKQAETFIRLNYSDRSQSKALGQDALRAAQHALYIAREAQKLQKLAAADAEQAALQHENMLHQVATATGAADNRNMAFKDQTLALIQHIQEQQHAQKRAAQLPAQSAPAKKMPTSSNKQSLELPAVTTPAADVDAPNAEVIEAAPVEAAPVEAAPVEAAPVEAAPVEAAPVEAAPVEAAPVEEAPPAATTTPQAETAN